MGEMSSVEAVNAYFFQNVLLLLYTISVSVRPRRGIAENQLFEYLWPCEIVNQVTVIHLVLPYLAFDVKEISSSILEFKPAISDPRVTEIRQ